MVNSDQSWQIHFSRLIRAILEWPHCRYSGNETPVSVWFLKI